MPFWRLEINLFSVFVLCHYIYSWRFDVVYKCKCRQNCVQQMDKYNMEPLEKTCDTLHSIKALNYYFFFTWSVHKAAVEATFCSGFGMFAWSDTATGQDASTGVEHDLDSVIGQFFQV